jgi:hypothetical protein
VHESGVNAATAIKLGRGCIVVENDPRQSSFIVDRLKAFGTECFLGKPPNFGPKINFDKFHSHIWTGCQNYYSGFDSYVVDNIPKMSLGDLEKACDFFDREHARRGEEIAFEQARQEPPPLLRRLLQPSQTPRFKKVPAVSCWSQFYLPKLIWINFRRYPLCCNVRSASFVATLSISSYSALLAVRRCASSAAPSPGIFFCTRLCKERFNFAVVQIRRRLVVEFYLEASLLNYPMKTLNCVLLLVSRHYVSDFPVKFQLLFLDFCA